MSYIERNLLPNENIVYKAKIHWFIFIQPIFIMCLGIWLLPKIGFMFFIGAFLILFGVYYLIKNYLQKIGTEYAVTDKRVILKSGIIKRDALELVLTKCEGVRVSQSIFGRLLGFGSIIVTTGNVTNTFSYVTNPMDFRNEINSQINTIQMG